MSLVEMSLVPVIATYRWLLEPIAPFTWLGYGISTLDFAAALRLCVVLRQLKEASQAQYLANRSATSRDLEERSFVKDASMTLTVVYGGEAITSPWLGSSPSFMYSPVVPALYTALTAFVEKLPWLPTMSLKTELPLSILDGFSRSFLLCQLIPPAVTSLASPDLATSPWTLLLSSLFVANGGFFFVNLFSMLHPTGWKLTTPAEFREYGWSTTDLWCAPLITGLFALFTHAQPFWADAHAVLQSWMSGGADAVLVDGKAALVAEAVDPEVARAGCAVLLAAMFVTRTFKNFGGDYMRELRGEKKRVMRSKVDSKRYAVKTKTQ